MVDLMLAGDEERIGFPGVVRTVYDPCCGSGGMLMIAKERILQGRRADGDLLRSADGDLLRPAINPWADIHLFGQEVNPETWAMSKSDFFIKDPTGRDADNIAFGSTLSGDRHAGRRFDYLIANPPYGKDWKRDKAAVKAEHARGAADRFAPGLPRISDGQTLFLLHMLAHAKVPEEGGSRIAIIMNGSPLFTGDARSGESEIRRHVLENDLLEALVALPEQLFYNTGIATYVWILTNRKAAARRGKVQLIDATSFWESMRKSLGDKRRISADGVDEEGRRQPDLPRDPLRVPQDHRRAPASAQLPGQRGPHCAAGWAEGLHEPGQVEEAGRRGRAGGGERDGATGRDTGCARRDAGRVVQGEGGVPRGTGGGGQQCRP